MGLFTYGSVMNSDKKSARERKKTFNILYFRYLCCDLSLKFVKVSGFDNLDGKIL